MKIMYELDDNNYIKTYGIYHELEDAKGNMYCPFKIGNGDTIEIDIDEQTLSDIYKAYQVINGEAVLDEEKKEQILVKLNQPVLTNEQTNEQILSNIANDVINY